MHVIRNADGVGQQLIDKGRELAWALVRGKVDLPQLGSGHFSCVYALSDELILKVGGPSGYGESSQYAGREACFTDGFGRPAADPWPVYIEWTAGMRRRPTWAPRVYHLEFLRDRVYFAVCEKLTTTDHQSGMYIPVRICTAKANAIGVVADLHKHNFMRRRNGAIVVNDPFAPCS